MVSFDTPKQYINFNSPDFLYSSASLCSTLGKRILPLTTSRLVPYGVIYYCFQFSYVVYYITVVIYSQSLVSACA